MNPTHPSILPVGENLSAKMVNMSFVCAALVVSMHVGSPTPVGSFSWFFIEPLHEILGDMAVPYFFMASGFSLEGHMGEPGWYPREMKKRFRTLFVPYVLWPLLVAVYLMPVAILANYHAHRSWRWNLGFPVGSRPSDWIVSKTRCCSRSGFFGAPLNCSKKVLASAPLLVLCSRPQCDALPSAVFVQPPT